MQVMLLLFNIFFVSRLKSFLKSSSKEAKGSSINKICGSGAIALAIATLCCSPPDMLFG